MPGSSDPRWQFPAPKLGEWEEICPDIAKIGRVDTAANGRFDAVDTSDTAAAMIDDSPGTHSPPEHPHEAGPPAYPLVKQARCPAPTIYESRYPAGSGRFDALGPSGSTRITLDMAAPSVPATVHVVHTHIIHVEQMPSALALPSPRRRWLGRLGHAATMVASPALAVAATLWLTSGRTEVREITRIIEQVKPAALTKAPAPQLAAPSDDGASERTEKLAAVGTASAVAATEEARQDEPKPTASPKAMPLESMPAVVSATSKAIRTGVAQPWEGMGMSGYAVAGPVRLSGQQTCRRIAIWVDGQGPGANALGSDRCLASDGSWTAAADPQPVTAALTASSATAARP